MQILAQSECPMRHVLLRPSAMRQPSAPQAGCIHHRLQLGFGNQFHLFQSRVKYHQQKAHNHKTGQYVLLVAPRRLILV